MEAGDDHNSNEESASEDDFLLDVGKNYRSRQELPPNLSASELSAYQKVTFYQSQSVHKKVWDDCEEQIRNPLLKSKGGEASA